MDVIVGIDFGTRFSTVSIWRNNRLEVIPDIYGNRTIPSVVCYHKSAKLVGKNALMMKDINPSNTIYDVKRIIGRTIYDHDITLLQKMLNYKITGDGGKFGNIVIKLDGDEISGETTKRPEEVASLIFRELKTMAETYLQCPVSNVVVTVPAYYRDSQRQAIKTAVQIAELNLIQLINEPSAAALAYGMGNKKWINSEFGNVLVYDWGAGTLDLSLLNINKGVFTVLGVCGHNQLGGEDIDYMLLNFAIKQFKMKNKLMKFTPTKIAMMRLKNSCENAKKILSKTDKTMISVSCFHEKIDLMCQITVEEFNHLCHQVFLLAIEPLNDILKMTKLKKHKIDDVILVGGSTKIPKIKELILSFFKETKISQLNCSMNPDEVVSAGAAIRGYLHFNSHCPFGKDIMLIDSIPLNLGVETEESLMTTIVSRGNPIPIAKSMMFTTDTDYQTTINIKILEGQRKLSSDNNLLGILTLSGFKKSMRGVPKISVNFQVDSNGILQVTAVEKNSDISNSIQFNSNIVMKGRLEQEQINKIIQDAMKTHTADTIYAMKLGYRHELHEFCRTIGQNINNAEFKLTSADRTSFKSIIKETLQWLKDVSDDDVDVMELEKKVKDYRKRYSALITLPKKGKFKSLTDTEMGVDIHGDDKEKDENDAFIMFHDNSPSEIKDIKEEIGQLCQQLTNLITNPITTLDEKDVEHFNSYLESVNLWLYVVDSNTMTDYVAKINEINKFSENIFNKNESLFSQKHNFTTYDEINITCKTLYSSIQDNFISIDEADRKIFLERIENEIEWLMNHDHETDDIYQSRLESLEQYSNQIYQKTNTIKTNKISKLITETEEELDEALKDLDPSISLTIEENLDDMMDKFDELEKSSLTKQVVDLKLNKKNDVTINIDYDKLLSGSDKNGKPLRPKATKNGRKSSKMKKDIDYD